MQDLAVIIVSFNVRHFLQQCLNSLIPALAGIDAQVWVVDNHSADGSVQMVTQDFPWVKLIASEENLGFAKANNLAIRQAHAHHILLLNPDTVVEANTLRACLSFMEANPQAGALGCKMLDGKGVFLPESRRGLPTPWVSFTKMSGLGSLFPKSATFNSYYLGQFSEDETHEAPILSGAFFWAKKEALDKAGFLDEAFFMYGEDIDLSYRITLAGYKNYYFPKARIIHYKGESTRKGSLNYVRIFYQAMEIFAQKHFRNSWGGLLVFLLRSAIWFRAGLALFNRWLKPLLPLAFDSAVSFGAFFALKQYWQTYFKPEPTSYPETYMLLLVPFQICLLAFSHWLSGGYDKPFRPVFWLRGSLLGLLLVSALTNFSDSVRMSKALILLNTLCFTLQGLTWRFVIARFVPALFKWGPEKPKSILIVGEESESLRVLSLLKNLGLDEFVEGFVLPSGESKHSLCLGKSEQITRVVQELKIGEVIFCAANIPAQNIIETMMLPWKTNISFRTVADDSGFIIGSASSNAAGDFYTIPIELNLEKPINKRWKRLTDLGLSFLFILLTPILIWRVTKPKGFVKNLFWVLVGFKTWVGPKFRIQGYKSQKEAVVAPGEDFPELPARQEALLYVKNYNPSMDLEWIWRYYHNLGSEYDKMD